jgi:hypothetical protein
MTILDTKEETICVHIQVRFIFNIFYKCTITNRNRIEIGFFKVKTFCTLRASKCLFLNSYFVIKSVLESGDFCVKFAMYNIGSL